MTTTRSLYALDPVTQKVRLVIQVSPLGWEDGAELEEALGGLIPVLSSAGIAVALLFGPDATFVVRRDEKSPQYEVDELETTEALSPLPYSGDGASLFATVESWVSRVAEDWRQFVPETALPKRVPELVPLIVGSVRRAREGSIGLPDVTPVSAG